MEPRRDLEAFWRKKGSWKTKRTIGGCGEGRRQHSPRNYKLEDRSEEEGKLEEEGWGGKSPIWAVVPYDYMMMKFNRANNTESSK